jgi:hypothetical protein
MKQYRKIDIYVAGKVHFEYKCSTTQSKTLKEAKARFFAANNGKNGTRTYHIGEIMCEFAEPKR